MRWCTPTASASAYRVFCARANSTLHNTTPALTCTTASSSQSLSPLRRRYSTSHAYSTPPTPSATAPTPVSPRTRSRSGSLHHSHDTDTNSSLVSALLSSRRPFVFDRVLSDSSPPPPNTRRSRDRPPPRPPELALAAAQAVRLALARNMPYQAKHILRSLLPPLNSQDIPQTEPPSPGLFNLQGVSPRPASHAFLHGLLRNNEFEKAAHEATRLLEAGVRIHTRTLETVMQGASLGTLTGTPSTDPGIPSSHMWHERAQRSFRVALSALTSSKTVIHPLTPNAKPRRNKTSEAGPDFDINPETIQHKGTRLAVMLLAQARREQHQRTEHMFASLVHAVLLRGQLAFASVLIAVLVRDWQLRKAAVAAWEAASSDSSDGENDNASLRDNGAPSPKPFSLWPIIRRAQDIVSSSGLPPTDPHMIESAQALTILAHLLDTRALPFGSVAQLIRAMYAFPNVRVQVWLPPDPDPILLPDARAKGSDQETKKRHNGWKSVDAYEYMHSVLCRLASAPPSAPPVLSSHRTSISSAYPRLLPPLDLKSYNALLHYSLRHRRSPALASSLLTHMTETRRGPLRPDSVTANIVLRGGTLLRREDISQVALQWLRMAGERDKNLDETLVPEEQEMGKEEFKVPEVLDPREYLRNSVHSTSTGHDIEVTAASAVSAALAHPEHPATQDDSITHSPSSSVMVVRPDGRHRPLSADSHSLSTYITHLTATGNPSAIVEPLFQLLPELLIIEHPSLLGAQLPSPTDQARVRHEGRLRALERGVRLGPHFFTAVLNALSKAGRTGLTERVWLFAKECETLSWRACRTREGMAQGMTPWVLPVQAYTAVMQRYAQEARKGMLIFRDKDLKARREYLAALDAEAHAGESLLTGMDMNRDSADGWRRSARPIKGWAKVVLNRHLLNKRPENARERRFLAWRAGLTILRSLTSAADEMRRALVEIRATRARILEEVGTDPSVDVGWAHALEPAAQPDARFFNAALALAAWRRNPAGSTSAQGRMRRAEAKRVWRRAQRRYASHGEAPAGWTPVLQAVAEELVGAGFRVPLGLRYLFVGKDLPVPREQRADTQEAVIPYFARRKEKERMPFRARALQTRKTRGMFVSGKKRRCSRSQHEVRGRRKRGGGGDVS